MLENVFKFVLVVDNLDDGVLVIKMEIVLSEIRIFGYVFLYDNFVKSMVVDVINKVLFGINVLENVLSVLINYVNINEDNVLGLFFNKILQLFVVVSKKVLVSRRLIYFLCISKLNYDLRVMLFQNNLENKENQLSLIYKLE